MAIAGLDSVDNDRAIVPFQQFHQAQAPHTGFSDGQVCWAVISQPLFDLVGHFDTYAVIGEDGVAQTNNDGFSRHVV